MDKLQSQRFYIIMSSLIISFIILLSVVIKLGHVKSEKIINISYRVPITSLDPAIAFDSTSLNIISQCYETLYEYHYLKRPFSVKPLLADGMPEVSEDHLTYTIKIRKNIPYHDHPAFNGKTRYVKAQDFINQFKRLAFLPLKSSGHQFFSGKIIGFDKFSELTKVDTESFYTLQIDGLIAKDDHTLVIKFKEKLPHFLYLLTMTFVVPVPIEVIGFYSNNLKSNLVGTGPFFLKRFEEEKVTLKKFENYPYQTYPESGDRFANDNNLLVHAGEQIPFLNEVNFYLEKEPNKQWKMFKSDILDILSIPTKNISNFLDKNNNPKNDITENNYQVIYYPSLVNSWLAFNMKDPVLGKKNSIIRKAIAHAINYSEYIKKITNNTALRANSLLTPGIPGYDPKTTLQYEYNPELAKKYLLQAGYPDGNGFPTIIYSTRTDEKGSVFEGEFIKNELAKIGINVDIQVLSFKQFWRMARTGQLQMWTDNWVFDYPDPQSILQLLYSKNHPGINKSAYWNYKVDSLYLKLNQTTAPDERKKYLREIESIINNDTPWALLTYQRTYVLLNKCVRNYRGSSFIRNYLKYIDYSCP